MAVHLRQLGVTAAVGNGSAGAGVAKRAVRGNFQGPGGQARAVPGAAVPLLVGGADSGGLAPPAREGPGSGDRPLGGQ